MSLLYRLIIYDFNNAENVPLLRAFKIKHLPQRF